MPKQLKVGFILPSSDYLVNPFRGEPFTQLHILTILEDHFGDQLDLCLVDLRGIEKKFALYHIPKCDIYLHSVYTLDYNEQVSIVNELRKKYPEAIHIAGGPHANEFPNESLKIFDSLIIGEGEKTIITAVEDIMHSALQKIYQQPSIIDINAYPYWRRKYLPDSTVAKENLMVLKRKDGYDKILAANVLFSRGCPYNCHFCAIKQMRRSTPGIRFRSPEHVEAEIEYLKTTYGIQGLVLSDEISIPLRRDQAISHLKAIEKSNILWRGQCRVDGITPELAALARKSGCIAMGLGVESVIQKSLDIINKKISVEKSKETIKLLKDNDIEARIYMIMGLPGEPEDVVERTWAFIEETDPDLVYLGLFTARPGTEIFDHPERFAMKNIKTDWDKTMHHGKKLPMLTFEYEEIAPWGRSLSSKQILDNYFELRKRLAEKNLSASEFFKNTAENSD